MLLNSYLLMATLVTLGSNTQPVCNIVTVPSAGIFAVTASVQPFQTGTLSFRLDTIVSSGSNKSRTVNAGDVEIVEVTEPVTVWQGQIKTDEKSQVTIRLKAKLNEKTFFCEAEFS